MSTSFQNHIPIDFMKAMIIGIPRNTFFDNPILHNPTSIFKGELHTKTIFKHKNLTIKIFENNNRIELSGSLHTFYNDGLHNHNDFNHSNFKKALKQLEIDLGIKPKNLYIIQLEWGFNLTPPKESNYILDRLIQHNSVNRTAGHDCIKEGKYFQFKHSTHFLKIYNKGLHFNLNKEVIRIELKQTNWHKYRSKGFITLEDFIKNDKTIFLKELIHQWNRVIIYDIDHSLTSKHIKYQSPLFWNELRVKKSRKTVKHHFDKLKELNQTKGFNVQNRITELIIQKGNELQL